MSWYTVNVWWMECTVQGLVKNTVKSTAESFKPGILKIKRNRCKLIFWPFKKGLVVRVVWILFTYLRLVLL